MNLTGRWLEPFTWDFVTVQNEILCRQKSAHHGPTSDGHEEGKKLREQARQEVLSLFESVEVCRRCHRIAPFTNFNGNTFAAIARILVKHLGLDPQSDHIARSLAGHIVAGVASDEEVVAFRKFCEGLG
jgi:ATP-dependent Clp protease ATP-binding subunit ClpA